MDDLEIAKQRLKDKNLNLVFVKNFRPIFETKTEGLHGFLEAIKELDGNLSDASVADKIIGKAAALLCAYSDVAAAFTVILSKGGLEILKTHNIRHEFENLVPTILNVKKTDKCPLEKLVANITNSEEAYEKISRFCCL